MPVGASWCQTPLAPSGTLWHLLAPTGTNWRPLATAGATGCVCLPPRGGATGRHWSPVGASWCQLVPDPPGTFWHPLAPSGTNWHQLATTGDRWRHRARMLATEGRRHWSPLVASWCQLVPVGARILWHLLAPSGTFWHQHRRMRGRPKGRSKACPGDVRLHAA